MPNSLIRRYRRHTNDPDRMPLSINISRGRSFSFALPDDVPFDHDDADRIVAELAAMEPPPDDIDEPVASGLGDLVCDGFVVTYWDDERSDDDILLDIEDAVRRGLTNRVWVVPTKYAYEYPPGGVATRTDLKPTDATEAGVGPGGVT